MNETVKSLNAQAIQLASVGEYNEAIACFKRALSLEKTNYLLWFNLGVTYRDAGNLEQAKASLEKAVELNPNDTEILDTMAIICNNMKDNLEAMAYCAQAMDISPSDPHIWNTAGVILFNQGDYTEASEAFEHAVTLNPYYYDALFNLRDTYDELGNEAGKAECIERMKSLSKQGFNNA